MDKSSQETGVIGWIDRRLSVFTILQRQLHEYPMPRYQPICAVIVTAVKRQR